MDLDKKKGMTTVPIRFSNSLTLRVGEIVTSRRLCWPAMGGHWPAEPPRLPGTPKTRLVSHAGTLR
jgi:hypothetical protein